MIHYAVVVDGRVVGMRSSTSHTSQIYTHALLLEALVGTGNNAVMSYHRSERLAQNEQRTWSQRWVGRSTLSVVPVVVTAKRAKIGEVL